MALVPDGHKWRGKNFVQVALCILDEDASIRAHPSLRDSCLSSSHAMYQFGSFRRTTIPAAAWAPAVKTKSCQAKCQQKTTARPSSRALIVPVVSATTTEHSATKDQPPVRASPCSGSVCSLFQDAHARLHFVQKTVQLLFTSECVVLLQYLVFTVSAMYSLAIFIHLTDVIVVLQQQLSRQPQRVRAENWEVCFASVQEISLTVPRFIWRTSYCITHSLTRELVGALEMDSTQCGIRAERW